MERKEQITKFITKQMRGIEIAPWHSPLAPKREGYNCLTLDIFNTEELRERSQNNELLSQSQLLNIEDVDIVGNATDLGGLIDNRNELGSYDYIVSSHNFEHLPNPIKFLQGCSRVLKPNGLISMAIPDKRGCFDYFRPHSITADFIEAFFEDRMMPTLSQQFAHSSLNSRFNGNIVFMQNENPEHVKVKKSLSGDFEQWKNLLNEKNIPPDIYADTHCFVFTPASFFLIINDLRFLRLSSFEIISMEPTGGAEFFVHMRNKDLNAQIDEERFYDSRQMLLHAINDEIGSNSLNAYKIRQQYMSIPKELDACKKQKSFN